MATGNYGTVRPADVSVEDIEILYSYNPTRENTNQGELISLNPSQVLVPASNPNNSKEILGGMYTLKLPTSDFSVKGYYNIIIRPKQIRTSIVACGTLASSPDIIGMVINLNDSNIDNADKVKLENGNLVGYRVEYLTTNTNAEQDKIQNLFRVVTSNNRVLAVSENLSNSSDSLVQIPNTR